MRRSALELLWGSAAVNVPAMSLRLVWRGDREALPGLRDLLYAAVPTHP
jgi:hypothetical protein